LSVSRSCSMILPRKSTKGNPQKRKREKKRKPNPLDDTPGKLVEFDRQKHILMGRGGRSNNNPANKVWRAAVDGELKHYHQQEPELKYGEKIAVSEAVVDAMYEQGKRFATPETSNIDMVRLLSYSEGVDKTNQRFRDTKPEEEVVSNSKQSDKPNASKAPKKRKKRKKK